MREPELRRLFQAAAKVQPPDAEMPFGFDTRLLASIRNAPPSLQADLLHLLRRVVFLAAALMILTGAAAWWQLNQNRELASPFSNAYAIADHAIQGGALE